MSALEVALESRRRDAWGRTRTSTDVRSPAMNGPVALHNVPVGHRNVAVGLSQRSDRPIATFRSPHRNVPIDLSQRSDRPIATFRSTYRNVPIDLPQRSDRPIATFRSTYRNVPIDLPQSSDRPIATFRSTYRNVPIDLPQSSDRPTATFRSTYRNVPIDLPQSSDRPIATFRSTYRNVPVELSNAPVNRHGSGLKSKVPKTIVAKAIRPIRHLRLQTLTIPSLMWRLARPEAERRDRGEVLEIPVSAQHDELVPDAESGEEGINRADLKAATTTSGCEGLPLRCDLRVGARSAAKE
jgi:hypothetical protein